MQRETSDDVPIGVAGRLRLAKSRLGPALTIAAVGGLLALVPYPTCPVRLVFGVPCPGCGLTRAALATARLDFTAATAYNPLALPLVALTAATVALAVFGGEALWRRAIPIITGTGAVSLVVVWALRFLGFFGGPVGR